MRYAHAGVHADFGHYQAAIFVTDNSYIAHCASQQRLGFRG